MVGALRTQEKLQNTAFELHELGNLTGTYFVNAI